MPRNMFFLKFGKPAVFSVVRCPLVGAFLWHCGLTTAYAHFVLFLDSQDNGAQDSVNGIKGKVFVFQKTSLSFSREIYNSDTIFSTKCEYAVVQTLYGRGRLLLMCSWCRCVTFAVTKTKSRLKGVGEVCSSSDTRATHRGDTQALEDGSMILSFSIFCTCSSPSVHRYTSWWLLDRSAVSRVDVFFVLLRKIPSKGYSKETFFYASNYPFLHVFLLQILSPGFTNFESGFYRF